MNTASWLVVGLVLACICLAGCASSQAPAPRRVEVHLFGGDLREGAPLAQWYGEIGITDVWIYPLKGAFIQDQRPETQQTIADLERVGTLEAYRKRGIRYWWFERPVPDYFYETSKRADFPKTHLWDGSAETDALWAGVCKRAATIYAQARLAGFSGLVYDNEAYYSYKGDESGKQKPWVWKGHENQLGEGGNYYRRGMQVGKTVSAAWPGAKVIMVYAFGYEGEVWWYRGFRDGGVDLYIGPEHTYGAGPPGDLGDQWYQSWWQGRDTKQTCDWKRTLFPFIADNQHVIAGLFPIDFGARKPNYRAKYFRQQVALAAESDPAGPIPVWIWPQGPSSPEGWQSVDYAEGESAEDYLQVLRDYIAAFAGGS